MQAYVSQLRLLHELRGLLLNYISRADAANSAWILWLTVFS